MTFLRFFKFLVYNRLTMKKNISLTITVSPKTKKGLEKVAEDYPLPTLIRLILDAASEHQGGLYSLLAKLGNNDRRY